MGTQKNFFEVYRKFGHVPSKKVCQSQYRGLGESGWVQKGLHNSLPSNRIGNPMTVKQWWDTRQSIFRWFIPIVCDYNITIDKVGKSKHNKTLFRYKESKDRQHVSALFSIRPSSVLTCRTKEESQCYTVHKYIVCSKRWVLNEISFVLERM